MNSTVLRWRAKVNAKRVWLGVAAAVVLTVAVAVARWWHGEE